MTALEIARTPPATDTRRGPPLVFVHGAFCAAWVWGENFTPWLAVRGWDCHALSLRGHGGSGGEERIDFAGVEDYVDDTLSVVDGLDAEPVLVGHSMGGMVVQRCLARRPFKAAILMASAPPNGLLESSIGLAWRDPEVFRQMSLMAALGSGRAIDREAIRKALFSDRVPVSELARWEPRLSRESRRVLMEMAGWNPFPPRPRGEPELLVMGAEKDMLFPPPLVAQTARHFSTEPVIFPNMGHTMMLEPDWEDVAARVHAWLDGAFPI